MYYEKPRRPERTVAEYDFHIIYCIQWQKSFKIELIAENELIKRLNEEIRNQVNQYSKKEFDYNTQLKEVNNLKEMINEYTDIKEKLLTDAENSKKGLVSKEKELTQEYEREKIELQMEVFIYT